MKETNANIFKPDWVWRFPPTESRSQHLEATMATTILTGLYLCILIGMMWEGTRKGTQTSSHFLSVHIEKVCLRSQVTVNSHLKQHLIVANKMLKKENPILYA